MEVEEATISPPDPSMIDKPVLREYNVQSDTEEDSILDDAPSENSDSDSDTNVWEVIEKGTERGKPKLVHSSGYSYVISRVRNDTRYWACSVRNSKVKCLVAVTEKCGVFSMSQSTHCHPPVAGASSLTKLKAAFKEKAQSDPFAAAPKLVDEAIDNHLNPTDPCDLPNPKSLYRTANRVRQATRPKHPENLKFDLNLDAIPEDFVQADISVRGKRHFLLATSFMLSLLVTAKNWFVDGTFKVVRAPFVQLFSIHAFVRQGDNLKQIPLVYFLMSGKSSADYEAIFTSLLRLLPRRNLAVKSITLDFEAATWTALRKVLPSVSLRGCLFHWNQAIWRHIQHLGLVSSYMKKDSAYKFCRRVMALPFLPAESIYPMFSSLRSSVPPGPYVDLMSYIDQTWMKSSVWSIESWCVFKRSIRTNNDCEGWHRRLNNIAPGQAGLNMYFLFQILFTEARGVNRQVKFVSEGKILRYQRNKYARHQGLIIKAWEDFESDTISQKELLRICGRLNGPIV